MMENVKLSSEITKNLPTEGKITYKEFGSDKKFKLNDLKDFFNLLLHYNNKKDDDNMSELMVSLQSYLIDLGALTKNLFPIKVDDEKVNKLTEIFLNVRREYTEDTQEETNDFSYWSVALDWLNQNKIKYWNAK